MSIGSGDWATTPYIIYELKKVTLPYLNHKWWYTSETFCWKKVTLLDLSICCVPNFTMKNYYLYQSQQTVSCILLWLFLGDLKMINLVTCILFLTSFPPTSSHWVCGWNSSGSKLCGSAFMSIIHYIQNKIVLPWIS